MSSEEGWKLSWMRIDSPKAKPPSLNVDASYCDSIFNLTHFKNINICKNSYLFKATREGFDASNDLEMYGIDMSIHSIIVEKSFDKGSLSVEGPNAGIDLSTKLGPENSISLMAEASVAKAESTLDITKNVALTVTVDLNCNTGVKIGSGGVKASFLGFGLTMGVGGKWTIDTPVGSVGGCPAQAEKHKNKGDKVPVKLY